MSKIILASGSTARAQALRSAGVHIDAIIPAKIDEDEVKNSFRAEGRSARDLADALAEIKARRVSSSHSQALVLGADQVLVHDGQVFDKPKEARDAQRNKP